MIRTSVVLFVLFASASAHFWLLDPVSRKGTNDIGGTTAPCNNMAAGSGTRTALVQGGSYTLIFRVNQHGPDPFRLALSPTGDDKGYDDAANVIADNFKYVITAEGGTNYNEMKLAFKVPATPCAKCSLQLKGMGTNGAGTWYQCADVSVGPPPTCPADCTTGNHGVCQPDATCKCNSGWSGVSCSIAVAANGGVQMAVIVTATASSFDQNVFKTKMASTLGVPTTALTVVGVIPVKGQSNSLEVTFAVTDVPASGSSAAIPATSVATKFSTMMANPTNAQMDIGYPIASNQDAAANSGKSTTAPSAGSGKKTSGGVIAAAILVPVALLAIGGVAFMAIKKRGGGGGGSTKSAPALPPRV